MRPPTTDDSPPTGGIEPGEPDASHGLSADPLDDDTWLERRDRLSRRLKEQRRRMPDLAETDRGAGNMNGMAQGLRIASEFIGGILVGAALGYGVDRLFDTTPFGLIFFLLVGFAAGVLNVIRGVSTPGGKAAAEKQHASVPTTAPKAGMAPANPADEDDYA